MKDNQDLRESVKPKGLSIKRAIGALAGVAVTIAILYMVYLSHNEFEETMVFQTQKQLLPIAKATARTLEESIAHHLEALKAFSKNPSFQEQNQQYRLLKILYETRKEDADAIYLLDPNGIVLYRHPSKVGGKDRVGVSLSDRPGVSYVLKERKPYVSEVFHNKLGELSISISEPIFYEDKFTGIVRWMISMHTLSERFILPVKVGEKGYAWLLDDDGTVVMHPKAEHVGRDIMALRKEKFPDYDWSELEDVVEKMTKGKEGVGIYHSAWWIEEGFETLKKLTAYAPVHIGNELWSVGVSMGYSEIAAPIHEHARTAFGLAGLVILLFAVGGAVLLRSQKQSSFNKHAP